MKQTEAKQKYMKEYYAKNKAQRRAYNKEYNSTYMKTYYAKNKEKIQGWKDSKPLYHTWISMKQRCSNPKARHYDRYGGRGIKVCQAWLDSYSQFETDMGPRPKGQSVDRIDNDGDYSPSNCKWSTAREQFYNK